MNFKENYQDILNLCQLTAKGKFVNMSAFDMLSELYLELQDSEFDLKFVSEKLKSIIYKDKDRLPLVYTSDIATVNKDSFKPIDTVDALATKRCSKCKKNKEVDKNYYIYTRNGYTIVNNKCKECCKKTTSQVGVHKKYLGRYSYSKDLSFHYVKAKMVYSKKYTKEQLEENPELVLDKIEQLKIKRMKKQKVT